MKRCKACTTALGMCQWCENKPWRWEGATQCQDCRDKQIAQQERKRQLKEVKMGENVATRDAHVVVPYGRIYWVVVRTATERLVVKGGRSRRKDGVRWNELTGGNPALRVEVLGTSPGGAKEEAAMFVGLEEYRYEERLREWYDLDVLPFLPAWALNV